MRGKKVDKQFISSFIEKTLTEENTSFISIVEKIDKEINEINKKIIEVESLKKRRCNLLDVKEYLEKKI